MIWKNFRREFAGTISRLVSVVIIAAVAVMMYVSLGGLIYNALNIAQSYHEEQNVADFWITGMGFDKSDCNKIQAVSSVKDVDARIVLDCEDRYNSEYTLTLYSMPDNASINIPYIVQGEYPENNREIMLSDMYAKEHNISLGDTYEIKVSGTNTVIKTTVSALIKSPECMHHINGTVITPDFNKFAFAYIREDAVEWMLGKNIYNQICITTNNSVSNTKLKKEISDILGTKLVNILALEDNINAYNVIELIKGIEVIVMIFPIIFFIVAVLIMFSTMSRLIENSRTEIGTFKALGYSDRTIMFYYLLYAIFVVILGYIVGVIPANQMLTIPVLKVLTANVDMPPYTAVYDPKSLIVSFIIVFVICIGTAYVITAKSLKENPSQCMRPKAPPTAKKILPERIPFIWNLLNFTGKYVTRNMLRNKGRMAICIVGISACMTLILTAFGINDSIKNYLELMRTKQHKYDITIALKSDVTPEQYKHIGKLECVTDSECEQTTGVKLYSPDKYETTYFNVVEDNIYLKLINIYGDESYTLPEDGIVLDNAVAKKLNVAVGDSIKLKFPGDSQYYEVKVSEVYTGIEHVYCGRKFWRNLGKEYIPTNIYAKTDNMEMLENRLSDYEFVDSYAKQDEIITALENQVDTMVTIVYLLIIFGGILALVVLYNLGIVSFYEQIRSLATLMVLGFKNKEIKRLVLSENIIFAVVGIVVGIPLGAQLTKSIIQAINSVHFELHISLFSYIIAGLLTLSFAMIVNMMLSRKMKNIDMLEALKSVE